MADIGAADAVKLFKDAKIVVRVPKLDKDGNTVRDPETLRYIIENKPLSEALIVGVRDLGAEVAITTVDGCKYRASKAGK